MNRLLNMMLIMLIGVTVKGQFRKQPYLIYAGENTQMKIMYQLTTTDTCQISWGTDSSALSETMPSFEYGNDHMHEAVLSNLTPGTRYYYEVQLGAISHGGAFTAAPDTNAANLSFIAYGDTRSYPNDHDMIAGRIMDEVNSDDAFRSLVLSVGDLVSHGDYESEWTSDFFNPVHHGIRAMMANLPYQACRGNHEQSAVLFQKYFSYPFENGKYWSFDYGPAHFVVVDQYTSYGSGSTQLNWITADLAGSNKPWKFILLHEPGWSAGGHSNNTSVQNYLQPLCEEYNVQIVFGGHNHYYARAVTNHVTHITTGGGGAPLYAPNLSYPNIIEAEAAHHYCKIEIEGDLLSWSAVDEDGRVIDDFLINRFGIKPFNVRLSDSYLELGTDSLLMLTELDNPFNHALEVQALVRAESGTYNDTIHLFDDGAHSDGEAGDGLWGRVLGPVLYEDRYSVDIAIRDLDAESDFVMPDQAQFTTIGPLYIEDYFFYGSDTIPNHGDSGLKMKIILGNAGMNTTATDVSAILTVIDTTVNVRVNSNPMYGPIAAGETAVTEGFYRVEFYDVEQDSVNARFELKIASNDYVFWRDTLAIQYTREAVDVRTFSNQPSIFKLIQNYPNPFNPSTTINYTLPTTEEVRLTIYDLAGREVIELVSGRQATGVYSQRWDGLNASGSPVQTGVYFCRLQAGSDSQTVKMLYLK